MPWDYSRQYGSSSASPTSGVCLTWLGVREESNPLTELHEHIEEQTTALGFDPEDHAFTPHVTLAHLDHASGKERPAPRSEP